MPPIRKVARQEPIAPFNQFCFDRLGDLKEARTFHRKRTERLARHLARAGTILSSVAGELIDSDTRHDAERALKRRRAEKRGQPLSEHDAALEARQEKYKRKVARMTERLDYAVRKVVDRQVWVQADQPEVVRQMVEEVDKVGKDCRSRKRRRPREDEGEAEEDNEDEEDEEMRTAMRHTPPPSSKDDTPWMFLRAARKAKQEAWSAKSLRDRYSENNTYIEFYRTVHDARHPGEDVPPVPPHSLWFASEENASGKSVYVAPGTQQAQRSNRQRVGQFSEQPSMSQAETGSAAAAATPTSSARKSKDSEQRKRRPTSEPAEDPANISSDLEIAHEKISLKCPITLLPFTEPLTSTKCPHSFDRAGIEAMIQRSTRYLPSSRPELQAQMREPIEIGDEEEEQEDVDEDDQAARRPGRRNRGTGAASSNRRRQAGGSAASGPGKGMVRAIPCPVCSIPLREEDLRFDTVLLRKVERMRARQAREREEAEEEEDEDGNASGTLDVGGSGVADVDDVVLLREAVGIKGKQKSKGIPMHVKRENVTRVAGSSGGRGSGNGARSRNVSIVPDTQPAQSQAPGPVRAENEGAEGEEEEEEEDDEEESGEGNTSNENTSEEEDNDGGEDE